MTIPRRKFLHLAAGTGVFPVLPQIAFAQAYPARPLSLIVFVPAGGTPDIIARLVGQALSQRLGQSVVIDNRPGGGGNIALQAVARAPADGYTLLMVATPHAINVTLYEKSTVTLTRDIAPGAGINSDSFVLIVNPAFPRRRSPSSLPTAKAIRAKSTWPRPGRET
jgi:tripartite-type tricarboxylate transporter receptor subunit TctC